jgi:hypothetical protein
MNNKWISEYINEISDTNEDTDLGHTDNEPDMLSSDLSVIARYAAELKDVMDTLSNTNDEIDLPHWWQAKVIKAKDYLIGAKHYLRAELEKNQSNTITSEDYKKKLEERVMELTEKNVPTDSSKWSYYKSQAKKKFDVYPSAYANGWAAKQYKAAGGGWKTENKESVDEAKSMDMNKRLKVYDKLKKGDEITIKYGSSMSSGREGKFKVTKGKTVVGKEKVERIILQNVANPKGVKYYLYQRNGNVTMAIGDMGATIEDMSESVVNESINENDSYSIRDDKGRPFLLIVGESPKDSKGKSEYKKDGFYISPQKGFKGLITAYFKDEKTLKKNIDKKYHNQLGESVMDEAKAKSKDTKGIRLAEAIYNNVEAIMEAVEREKMDVDTVVGSFGPVLVNAIKATLKHKFKPTDGNEVKLKDFYSELKDLLKVAESLVNRPSKAGLNKLAAAHTIWWNHKSGAAVVLNGKHTDNIVESVVNEAKEPEVITQLRKIVKDKQNDLIKDTKTGRKIRVDMNSANLMIQVYDALKSQSNKDKFVNGGVVSMGIMAFKLMKKEDVSEVIEEGEYQGRKVELNKPMQGDVKKFKVYVNNEKGNVVKVNFGQKGMVIKKDNPAARKSFRARMNCDNPGPKWKANYWSCRKW